MKRFKLSRPTVTGDAKGTVQIQIKLQDPERGGNYPKRGNIVRSLTVYEAKVSEVVETIRRQLEKRKWLSHGARQRGGSLKPR
jgi:hypothetical protein